MKTFMRYDFCDVLAYIYEQFINKMVLKFFMNNIAKPHVKRYRVSKYTQYHDKLAKIASDYHSSKTSKNLNSIAIINVVLDHIRNIFDKGNIIIRCVTKRINGVALYDNLDLMIVSSTFNSHRGHVFAFLDKMLCNDYLCLVASRKQQIKRTKI